MKAIDKEIKALLIDIIKNREKALRAGEATKNDLLGILLESNHREIQEHGNNNNVGMNIKDVIAECKLFYFAGQETTSSLLVWTMILLSMYPDWQTRARVCQSGYILNNIIVQTSKDEVVSCPAK